MVGIYNSCEGLETHWCLSGTDVAGIVTREPMKWGRCLWCKVPLDHSIILGDEGLAHIEKVRKVFYSKFGTGLALFFNC